MQTEMTAGEIEQEIRKRTGPTNCTIRVDEDPTGWHATVGGFDAAEVGRINNIVMNAEAEMKTHIRLKKD